MRIRPGYALAALALTALAACTQGTGGATQPAPTTSAAPSLPTITKDHATQDIESMISVVAQHATSVLEEDRHPQFKEVDGIPCPPGPIQGKLSQVEACRPTTASQPIVIEISLEGIRLAFQAYATEADASDSIQESVLDSYIGYLTYREIQRKHPEFLTNPPSNHTVDQIWACKTGEVYDGLKGSISPSLEQGWTSYYEASSPSGIYFQQGTQGKC